VNDDRRAELAALHPDALFLSSRSADDVAHLRDTLIAFFEASMTEAELFVPYTSQGRLGELYENARLVSETYEETGRRMHIRGLPGAIAQLQRTFSAG
jgi:GTP-binding protein HflX